MLIAGAGGFAKEILEIFLQQNYKQDILFYDDADANNIKVYDTYTVLKTEGEVKELFKKDNNFCLGIGGTLQREKMFNKFISLGGEPATITSPYAHIGKNNITIGKGCSISTGAIATTNISIGKGCLINLNCTIGHGTNIGEFCEISPGVHISGNCSIDHFTFIGTGAVILPGITIGKNVVIGAGAVITKSIPDGQVIIGIPGKPM